MLKHLLLIPVAVLMSLAAQAQFRYTVKDTTTPYVPLTGATSLNGSLVWDDEDLTAPMPFTWKMDSTISLTDFNLALVFPGVLADLNAFSDLNGFLLGDIDVVDRGTIGGTTSLSPIRYATTGTTPNRIFKLELANAGFYNEASVYSTLNDSFGVQVWIYETKNIVEMHFGPSRITHGSDYWGGLLGSTGPLFAYGKHVDFDMGSSGDFYYLKGNPAMPGLDTLSLVTSTAPAPGLNAWPANGKVYRFTPKGGGACTLPVAAFSVGAPAGNTVQYTYNGSSPVDSVRWNFGDGTTSTVMNPSHTFTGSGRYNVCVTAYNSCGSNVTCRQQSLAVGNLAALGNVTVYPNPAHDYLTIEGLEAGDQATVSNIVGQQVMSQAIGSSRQTLSLASLPAGSYTLMLLRRDGASGTMQIVKQ